MSRIPSLAVLVALAGPGLGCGGQDPPCGSLARLCADPGRWRSVATHVQDGVMLDLDGDGEEEGVALSRSGRKLSLGYDSGQHEGWRSMLHFDAEPVGLEALPGEVAVALTEPPRVVIFGVDGSGGLERRRELTLSSKPAALHSCDLAGDGAPGLIATLPETGRLAVVDPRSGDTREYAAGSQPSELAVGDVDRDGHLDVVVVDAPAGALVVLRGAGDGTLKRPTQSPTSAEVRWLALADHDGDGDLDAVTRDSMTNVLVHHNDGDGRFSSPLALPIDGALSEGAGVVAGPVASSGLVGVSVPQGKRMRTWFGKGAAWLGYTDHSLLEPAWWVGASGDEVLLGGSSYLGRFERRAGATAIEVWSSDEASTWVENEVGLATGDLDGDHLLDFAAAAQGVLHVFHGRADRGFERSAQFELEDRATAMVIADVTGDGRSEIVINEGTRARAFFRGDDGQYVAGPSFEPPVSPLALVPLRTGPNQPVVIAATPRPQFSLAQVPGASLMRFAPDGSVTFDILTDELFVDGLIAVDVDEDGVDEPWIVGRRDVDMVITRMTPEGAGFNPGPEHLLAELAEVTPDPGGFRFFAAGDLNGDGGPEVFVDVPDGRLRITGVTDDAPQATFEDRHALTDLRDVDGDGLLDAVFLHLHQFYYEHGHGDGTFAPDYRGHVVRRATKMVFAAPGAQFDLVALESDVVSAHLVREAWLPGRTGPFITFQGAASAFVSADLDLDGHDDVVTMSEQGGVGWMWGSETDPFASAAWYSRLGEIEALTVGDLDGDGSSELLLADELSRVSAILAPPRFEALELFLDDLNVGWIMRLAIADVDADGRADILALHSGGLEIELSVAYGAAEPLRYEPWQDVASVPGWEHASLHLGDVDGDGDLDVVIDPETVPGVLVRAGEARAWAEAEVMPGQVAMFSSGDGDGRVDLVTQDGTTIYRHVDGDPDRRTELVTNEEGVLVRAADADGDGRYELAVVQAEKAFVWLHGDEGSRRVQLVEAPSNIVAVDFPDVDGDRRPDFVALTDSGEMFVRCTRAPAAPEPETTP